LYYGINESKSRINLQASYRLCLFSWSVAEKDIQRFVHASAPISCAEVPMVFMFVRTTVFYARYFIVLHYHTVLYFFFVFLFFCFLTIHKHKNRGNMMVLGARIEGRGVGCKSEVCMKSVCGINSIMKRGVLHASKERKRVSKVQDSLVFQKRLQLRDHRQQVCPDSGQKFLLYVLAQQAGHAGR
jgi:hypothetical protein